MRQLLLAGCVQKGAPKPIRFWRARGFDCGRNLASLLRAKAHGEDGFELILLGQWGPSHLAWHTRRLFVYKNKLTRFDIPFTESETSSVEVDAFQQQCPHVSGKVSNQRHPAVTGAGKKRLGMNVKPFQARSLAIEATGDFFRNKVTPKIRLSGQWLERAGFRPGHRVQVTVEQTGSLTLRFVEQGKEVAL